MSENRIINKARGGRSSRSMGSVALTLLVALLLWYFNGGADNLLNPSEEPAQPAAQTGQNQSTSGSLVEANSSQSSSITNEDAPAGMPIIEMDSLPPEAIETINLIWSNGPYPFDKDDTTFQNREGFLPDEAGGYYREYTVITPGLNHRGARRIVSGASGELYYTDDHYESFSWINTQR